MLLNVRPMLDAKWRKWRNMIHDARPTTMPHLGSQGLGEILSTRMQRSEPKELQMVKHFEHSRQHMTGCEC